MSWSINKQMGKPEKIRPSVESQLDSVAKYYEGKSEQKDVLDAKAALLSWLDETKCADNEVVSVEACGSRGGTWLNIKIDCSKLTLLL